MSNCIIALVKAPILGKVKTRLMPFLSAEDAAGLYKAFLLDLSAQFRSIRCDLKAIAYTPLESEGQVKDLFRGDFEFFAQKGKDLGERLKAAVKWGFEKKSKKLLLVGSDSPTLPNAHIHQAFRDLNHSEVVIGPSIDGGYYLIGFARPIYGMFDGISWGTDEVLTQSLDRVEKLGLKFALLPPWYDVDRSAWFDFLKSHLKAMSLAQHKEMPLHSFKFFFGIKGDSFS